MKDSGDKSGRCVALIPARSGSKSIKDKNIASVGAYPLLAYTIASARSCPHIDEVLVSTDSEEYASVAKRYGALVPFLRPAEISGDGALDDAFFRHYYDWVTSTGADLPSLVVHLRPTTPFRRREDLAGAIERMRADRALSSIRSMARSELTPYKMFREEGGLARAFMDHPSNEFYNQPRQVFPETYIPNGVVDVLRPEVLLEAGMLHGETMAIWETSWVPDIDSPEDLEVARRFLESRREFDYLLKELEQCS